MKRNSLINISLKAFAFIIVGLLHGGVLFAAEAANSNANASAKPINIPEIFFNPSFYVIFITIAVLLATVLTLLHSVKKLTERLVEPLAMTEEAKKEAAMKEVEHSWASKFMHSLTASVPVEQERDVLLDHNYDGIQELDNKLPPWWVWGFYVTIIFAVIYLAQYHVFKTGKLQLAEYKQEMQEAVQEKAELMKNAANNITFENVKQLTDATAIGEGKDIFKKNCVACHREDAGGNVGPNLTDDYWLHGGGIKNIFHTITEGVPAKGMIPWKAQLSPKQIQAVASYVMSLHGTNPPSPKEPQGDKWVEETKPSASSPDSTAIKDTTSKKM